MKRTLKVRSSRPAAFTLLDLLAVLAMSGLLVLMLLPARAGSRSRAQSFRCQDNLRQVTSAVFMYTHDNGDLFPPNPDDGTTLTGYTWCAGAVYGGMPGVTAGPQTFNPDILADPVRCLISAYVQRNAAVFRCTADPRQGPYSGTNAALVGTTVPAARTLSISSAVGTIDPQFATTGSGHSGAPSLPVNGAWLTGVHGGNTHNHPWRTYGKTSDLLIPAPASLLVVTEEDPYSINDGLFATCAATPEWVDWPSTLHSMGGVVSFADGHVELHKWQSASTRLTATPSGLVAVSPSNPDWNWVTLHTTARAY